MQTPATNRDERAVTLSTAPPRVNTIKGPPQPPQHLGRALAAQRNAEREEARRAREEEIAKIPPPKMARVLADKHGVLCKTPDNAASFRMHLRAGKVITDREYDFADLVSQGVKLRDVSEEVVEVDAEADPFRVDGKAALSVPAMLKALHDAGFELRPRADASPAEAPNASLTELEAMRAKVAELEARLAGEKTEPKKGR